MPNLSDYVSKPILLLFEAKLESKISGGIMHKKSKRLEYFLLGDDYNRAVAPKKIEFPGDDANVLINDLWIKHISDVDCSHHTITPLGKQVFSTDGKLLGIVTDLVLNDEFVCTTLLLEQERIAANKIIAFGDDIVLVKGKRSPKITKYIAKKIKYPETDDIKVKVLDEQAVENDEDFEDDYPITKPITLAQAILDVPENDTTPLSVQALEHSKTIDKSNSSQAVQSSQKSVDADTADKQSETKLTADTAEKTNNNRENAVADKGDSVADKQAENAKTANNAKLTADNAEKPKQTELTDDKQAECLVECEMQELCDDADENTLQNIKANQNRVSQGRWFEFPNPFRIISNYGFLLGRLVTKTIFSFNRELIVKEGDVITTPIVERARHAGKLVELTLNSKK